MRANASPSVTVGIVHSTLEDSYLLANQRFCDMLGYNLAEITRMYTRDIVHSEDRGKDVALRQQLLKGEINSFSGEKRYRRKDGSLFWVNRTVSLARDDKGTPLYLIRVVEDITRRKEEEERFRATFEQAAVGIALNDPSGRYLEVNDRLCEMLGYTRDELLAKNVLDDITHPGDRAASRQRAEQLLRGDILQVYAEKRYVRKDGATIRVVRSRSLVRGPDGKPRYLISIITDVTASRTAEDMFTASFEQAELGMSMRLPGNRTSPWLRVNQKLCDMLGYTRDEMMRMSAADITMPEEQDTANDYSNRILRGEISGYSRERRYRCKDGSIIWCNISISTVRDSEGKPSHIIAVLQDITARKQAEARVEQTFGQAAVGIVLVDFDSNVLEANQKFCDMTGYSREEVLGMNLRQVSHPDDIGLDTGSRKRLLAGEIDHFSSEKRYLRKDGQPIWVRRTTSLAHDIADNRPHFILVVEDITEHKTAEESLRATFDNAPVGIMHTAIDRRILRVNPKLCEILGYAQEELLAMTTADLLTPEYMESDRPSYMQQMMAGTMQSFSSQRPYIRKDGSLVWTNRTVSLVRNAAGQPHYFLRIVEDISERKQAEDALAQERRLLRTVMDAIPDRIYVKDAEGRFLMQNAALLKLRGVKRHEDIIGKTVFDIFPAEAAQRYQNEDQKILESGEPLIDREARTLFGSGLEGTSTWHLTSKVPLKDASGKTYGLVGVSRDITEQKQSSARILRLNRFFSTLSATNAAISRARDREALFSAICRIAVAEGGLGSAWIRIHDPDSRELRMVAHAGVSEDYFAKMRVSSDPDKTEGQGLAGAAFRENRIMIGNDMLNESALKRWRERAMQYGFHSLASLPLACNDEVIGVLTLQAKEAGFFDHELVQLLQQMAADISFALTGLRLQEQHQATVHALQQSDEQFRQLAQHIPQVFWITDAAQQKTIYVSPAYETVTGHSLRELESDPQAWLVAIHPEDRDRVHFARGQKAPLGAYDVEYRLQHKDGSVRWIHDRAFPVKDQHGKVYRIAGIAEDITETKAARERLANLAHYDSVTGLPNRVLLHDRLRQSIAQARRNSWFVGVLFLDLDRFKLVNDTLGHAAGDLLLKQVSVRLTRALRPSDTVARLSGDEFAVILSELMSPQNAGLVAQKLIDALRLPYDLDGNEVFVTASIGITLYPTDGDSIETLIRDADAAMYGAKSAGRNNYQYYTAEMNQRATEKLRLETRLRHAIEREEFVLHYQPKVDIASGEITGLEALLRWQSPDEGMVSPDQFIPLLEETGLIVQVGNWVTRSACAQIHAWREAGLTPVPVAVNLSARQLKQAGFGATLGHALAEFSIPAELIEIEITESSLMENPDQAIVVLTEIANLGVRLSADDFGTGYSSLSYLKRLPLDALKIDRSFVRDITSDPDDAAITRTVITLAHGLDLKVIAEGVETEEQLAFLGQNQCDEAQGYLFSRPLPVDACTRLLAQGSALHPARVAAIATDVPAVLLVDDDPDQLMLTRVLLQRDGHRVLETTSTRDAFELLATNRVGIIIADENMPGMSGVEFLRRAKLMYPDTMRIMFSGASDFGTATAAINEGEVHKFFIKGKHEDLLRREIRKKVWLAPH